MVSRSIGGSLRGSLADQSGPHGVVELGECVVVRHVNPPDMLRREIAPRPDPPGIGCSDHVDALAQPSRIIESAPSQTSSGLSKSGRQIFVAAARSGSAEPKASTVSQPS